MDLGRGFKRASEGILRIGSSHVRAATSSCEITRLILPQKLSPKILLLGSKLDALIPVNEMQVCMRAVAIVYALFAIVRALCESAVSWRFYACSLWSIVFVNAIVRCPV